MSTGLDDLLHFLVQQVALQGETGASVDDVRLFATKFYQPSKTATSGRQDETISNPVDKAFLGQVWIWLMSNQDICLGPGEVDQGLSLDQVEAHNARIASQHGASGVNDKNEPATADENKLSELRLFASEEQMWFTLSGHGPDHQRISALEFTCLSVIAAHRERGVLQPALVRITGQDKRSLPPRTNKLADKGYIVKKKILDNGAITSLLMLKRFADDANGGASMSAVKSWQEQRFEPHEGLIKDALEVLEQKRMITWNDLKILLDIFGGRARSKIVLDALHRFEHLGCVERIRMVNPAGRGVRQTTYGYRSMKFIRRPSEEDWKAFWSMGKSAVAQIRAQERQSRQQTGLDEHANGDDEGVSSEEDDADVLGETVPLWTPDRPLTNLAFTAIDNAGASGLSSTQACHLITGSLFQRPLQNLMFEMSESWYAHRSLASHHFAVLRDAAQAGRKTFYKYFSFPNFQTLVEQGNTSWETVGRPVLQADALVPPFQFGELDLNQFCNQGGNSTLLECLDPIIKDTQKEKLHRKRKQKDPAQSPETRAPTQTAADAGSGNEAAPAKDASSYARRHRVGVGRKYAAQYTEEQLNAMPFEKKKRILNSLATNRRYHIRKLQSDISFQLESGFDLEEVLNSLWEKVKAIADQDRSSPYIPFQVFSEVAAENRRQLYRPSVLAHTSSFHPLNFEKNSSGLAMDSPKPITSSPASRREERLLRKEEAQSRAVIPRQKSRRFKSKIGYFASVIAHTIAPSPARGSESLLSPPYRQTFQAVVEKSPMATNLSPTAHLDLPSKTFSVEKSSRKSTRQSPLEDTGKISHQIVAHINRPHSPTRQLQQTQVYDTPGSSVETGTTETPETQLCISRAVREQRQSAKAQGASDLPAETAAPIDARTMPKLVKQPVPTLTYEQQYQALLIGPTGLHLGPISRLRRFRRGLGPKSQLCVIVSHRLRELPWFLDQADQMPINPVSTMQAGINNDGKQPEVRQVGEEDTILLASEPINISRSKLLSSELGGSNHNALDHASKSPTLVDRKRKHPEPSGQIDHKRLRRNAQVRSDNPKHGSPVDESREKRPRELHTLLDAGRSNAGGGDVEDDQLASNKSPTIAESSSANLRDDDWKAIQISVSAIEQNQQNQISDALQERPAQKSRKKQPYVKFAVANPSPRSHSMRSPVVGGHLKIPSRLEKVDQSSQNKDTPSPKSKARKPTSLNSVASQIASHSDGADVFAESREVVEARISPMNINKPLADASGADPPSSEVRESEVSLDQPVRTRRNLRRGIKTPSGVGRHGGSLVAARKEVILEVVRQCGGIFPGDKEMFYPFATEWRRQHNDGRPDTKTVTNLLKQLVVSGKLRKVSFNFRTPRGETKVRSIIALPEVAPHDPKVIELQNKMEQYFPRLYIPPEADVDEDLRRTPGSWWTPGQQRDDWAGSKLATMPGDVWPITKTIQRNLLHSDAKSAVERLRAWQDDFSVKQRKRMLQGLHDADAELGEAEFAVEDYLKAVRDLHGGENPAGKRAPRIPSNLNPELRHSLLQARKKERKEQSLRDRLMEADQLLGEPDFAVEGYTPSKSINVETTQRQGRRRFDAAMQPSNARENPSRLPNSSFTQPAEPHYVGGNALDPEAGRQGRIERLAALELLDSGTLAGIYNHTSIQPEALSARRQSFRPIAPKSTPRFAIPPQTQFGPTQLSRIPRLKTGFVVAAKPLDTRGHPDSRTVSGTPTYDSVQDFFPKSGTFGTFLERPGWFVPTDLDDILTRQWPGKVISRQSQRDSPQLRFNRTVDQVLQWELNDPSAGTVDAAEYSFINFTPSTTRRRHILGAKVRRKDVTAPRPSKRRAWLGLSRARKRRSQDDEFVLGEVSPKRIRRRVARVERRDPNEDKLLVLSVLIVRTLFRGGDPRFTDWEMVQLLTGSKFNHTEAKKRWHILRKPWREWFLQIQKPFEHNYLQAYESGDVPPLDYDDARANDWKALIDWAWSFVFPISGEATKRYIQQDLLENDPIYLTSTRAALEDFYEVNEMGLPASRDVLEVRQKGVKHTRRREWSHREPLVLPVEKTPKFDEIRELDMGGVARSWVRANAITPEKDYNRHVAGAKLLSSSEVDIDNACRDLLVAKVLMQHNKGREMPGRTVDISERFINNFKANIGKDQYGSAASYKLHLDQILGSSGSENFSWHAQDGHVLAALNLFAQGLVSIEASSLPQNPFGLLKGSYKTRSLDKNLLRFNVELRPTSTYFSGLILPARLPKPRAMQRTDADGKDVTPLPVWIDIHGNEIDVMWEHTLCLLLSVAAARPGATTTVLEEYVNPSLEAWEIRLAMRWVVEAGLGSWVNEDHDGIKLQPWWWLWLASEAHNGVSG